MDRFDGFWKVKEDSSTTSMANRFMVAKSGNCLVCFHHIHPCSSPASVALDFSSEGEAADRQKPWPAVQ